MIPSTYRKVDVIFCFYAVNDKKTFNNLNHWLDEVAVYAPMGVRVVIVGKR